MKTLWKTINILLLAGILLVGVLLVGTMMPIPGNYKVKIVKSGSMEPLIRTGGIVVIKPESVYQVGDIVTFGADTKTQIPTTHRIIEMGDSALGQSIRTKGDANNAPDPRPTPMSEVHGKVIFTIPYVGYLLDFARKPIGFALLVGVPAFAVIIDELGKIIAEIRRLRRKKNGGGSMGNDSSNEYIVSLDALPKTEEKTNEEKRAHATPPVGLGHWPANNMTISLSAPRTLSYSQVNHESRSRRGLGSLPFKIIVAILLPAIFLASSSSIGSTVSYYADIETSINNFFKADPLGFTVTLLGSSQVDMSTGIQTVVPIFTPNSDSEPIQYSLSTYMTGGDTTLCGLILAESTSTFAYSGPLLLLSTQMTTTTGALPFLFSIPTGYSAPPNTSCFIDLIFTGRNADAKAGEGYSYTQKLAVQFYIPNEPVSSLASTTASSTTTASAAPSQGEGVQAGSVTIVDIPQTTAGTPTTTPPIPPSPDVYLGGTGFTPPPPPPAPEPQPQADTASSTDSTSSGTTPPPVVPETPTTTEQIATDTPPATETSTSAVVTTPVSDPTLPTTTPAAQDVPLSPELPQVASAPDLVLPPTPLPSGSAQ